MDNKILKFIGLTFFVQFIVFSIGLLNNALLSRWLGPELLGILILLIQVAELIYKLNTLGFESSILYYLSIQKYSKEKIFGNAVSNGIILIFLSSILTFLLYKLGALGLIFSVKSDTLHSSELWGCIFLIIAYFIFEYGSKILLGLQKYITFNRIFFFRSVTLLGLLLLIKPIWGLKVSSALLIYGLAMILPGIFMLKNIFPFKLNWNRLITRDFIKYGLNIYLTNLFTFFSYRADVFFIGFFWNEEQVGYYYIALLLAEKLHQMVQPTSTILFPAAAYSQEQQRKTPLLVRLNFYAILALAIALAVSASWLIPLAFSTQYLQSVPPFVLLLPGIAALTLPKVLGADLAARGLPKINMYIAIAIFLVKIILNIITIPRSGITGAAISSTVAYIFAAILIVGYYRKLTGVSLIELLLPRVSDLKNLRKI